MVWMFVPPTKKYSYFEIPMPSMMLLEGGRGCLSYAEKSPHDGISLLIKDTPQSSLVPSTMWQYQRSLRPEMAFNWTC